MVRFSAATPAKMAPSEAWRSKIVQEHPLPHAAASAIGVENGGPDAPSA